MAAAIRRHASMKVIFPIACRILNGLGNRGKKRENYGKLGEIGKIRKIGEMRGNWDI